MKPKKRLCESKGITFFNLRPEVSEKQCSQMEEEEGEEVW